MSGTASKGLALHYKILIAMALGVAIGLPLNYLEANGTMSPETVAIIAGFGEAAGKLFLALLSMVVVPLVFTSLVTAVTGLRGQSDLRKLGFVTISYYLVTSLLAIVVGLVLTNLIRPGAGLNYDDLLARARAGKKVVSIAEKVGEQSVADVLAGLIFRAIPTNVLEAARDNRNMLAVIFFALIFGYFINRSGDHRATRLATFFEDVFEVMMSMTHGIIRLAPYGIFGYIVFVTATTGVELARPLAKYMGTVALGLVIHACITLPILAWVFARRSPLALARAVGPALATAFSTASSSGTLPLTIRCLNDHGVKPRYTSFVLPLGATINMDGTALYEAAAVLFIAQMSGDLTLAQQIVVAFTALLASVGAAGIPHAGTVMMVIVLQAVGLPTEAVLTILAVDRVLDMMRTTVNVWSDVTCTAVVARLAERDDQ